jgi:hypothetical protein
VCSGGLGCLVPAAIVRSRVGCVPSSAMRWSWLVPVVLAAVSLSNSGAHGRKARKERSRPRDSPANRGSTAQQEIEQEIMEWVSEQVRAGRSPDVLRAALGTVASGGSPAGNDVAGSSTIRSSGLPKHAHSSSADLRLREPLMSQDAVTAAWGWYSGSLQEPASLPAEVISQYREHGHVLLRGFFDPDELMRLAPLLRETTAKHASEYERYMEQMAGYSSDRSGSPSADERQKQVTFTRRLCCDSPRVRWSERC